MFTEEKCQSFTTFHMLSPFMGLSHNKREIKSNLNKQGNASVKPQGLAEDSVRNWFGNRAIKKRKRRYISNQ